MSKIIVLNGKNYGKLIFDNLSYKILRYKKVIQLNC